MQPFGSSTLKGFWFGETIKNYGSNKLGWSFDTGDPSSTVIDHFTMQKESNCKNCAQEDLLKDCPAPDPFASEIWYFNDVSIERTSAEVLTTQLQLSCPAGEEEAENTNLIADRCLDSRVQLTGLRSSYHFEYQSGNLTMKYVKFSDSEGGACLSSFVYVFSPSEETEVESDFISNGQMLMLATERTDLPTIQTGLAGYRANGELLMKS
jgi:hypothetical protein